MHITTVTVAEKLSKLFINKQEKQKHCSRLSHCCKCDNRYSLSKQCALLMDLNPQGLQDCNILNTEITK